MEYLLQLEEKQRYWILGIGIAFICFFILVSCIFLGKYGLIFSLGLTVYILLTPLVYGRYKLFLFLWLFLMPYLNIFQQDPSNPSFDPINFLITGLTFPFATILIFNKLGLLMKKLPFVTYILIFDLLLIFNLFRPYSNFIDTTQLFRFHFIEVFIIAATFFFLKKDSADKIFNWINIFAISNAIYAIFQRITGIHLTILEGIPRVKGFFVHPNACGFFINIFFPLSIYIFLNLKTKKQKIIWGLSILLNLTVLLLTFSKTSFVIFGLTLFCYFLVLQPKYKIKFGLSLVFCSIILLLVNFIFNLNIFSNLINRFENYQSLNSRFQVWNCLLGNMDFITFLTGYGTNSSTEYLNRIIGHTYAHNGYLQMIYEFGVLGLSYIFSFFTVFILAIKGLLKKDSNLYLYLTLFLISMVVIIKLYFDQILHDRLILYFIWSSITILYFKLNTNNDVELKQE